MKSDGFINIAFDYESIDRYVVRNSIKNALDNCMVQFKGRLLDIGCGKMPYKDYVLEKSNIKEYVGLDIENALEYDSSIKPDYTWDGIVMPFDSNSFSTAIGTEVLEHCYEPEVILKEVHRVLEPGGIFFFTVPFLWNLHEVPHDEYRYTPFSLERHLKNSGFTGINIEATGGWHASMAQMLGLWLKRAPLSNRKRKWLFKLIKPTIAYLLKKDKFHKVSFTEGQMITGLSGWAKKEL